MGTVTQFEALLLVHGSDVIYHRDDSTVPCPCQTPEGFRDPEYHDANPGAEMCNERGFLPINLSATVKAFVQPVQAVRSNRMPLEYMAQMFGEIQVDDHFGIFPESWGDTTLEFSDWSQSGDSYIVYNNNRYLAVAANLVPDPADGNPRHHWEVGLRLISDEAPL